MKTIIRSLFICFLLFSQHPGTWAIAAEKDGTQNQVTPGGAEVIPRLAELKQKSTELQTNLESLQKTETFDEPLQIARERSEALAKEAEFLAGPAEWNFDRLLDTRNQLLGQEEYLSTLLNGVSLRLEELDKLRQQWQERQDFWRQWRQEQPADLLEAQKEAFREAELRIQNAQQQIVDAGKPLVVLQDEVVQLQEKNQVKLAKIDRMLETLRGNIFQKTARSFTSPHFYQQFNPSLLDEVRKGIEGVSGFGSGFFRMQGWLISLQLLLAAVLGGFLLHKRRQGTVRAEWKFIIAHPLATAIFVSIIACSPLYSTPPALWRLLLAILAAFSAAILVSGLLADPLKKLMIYILAGVFVTTMGLQIIALPMPLYRLYLSLLSLLGIPFLHILISRHRQVPGRRTDLFILALRLGIVMLVCSFAAQWGGYSTLSSRLIESSIKTVFLGLFAWMTLHLVRGGCEYLLNHPLLRRSHFVVRFGEELGVRLKKVLLVIILAYSAFYLLEIWGVFSSAGQAWQAFLQLGYTLGSKIISMHLVLMAVLALYASIQISWILRALLDTEFFPHRPVDRGVHNSIMRLLHYGVITIGFLLAMSLLGFELKNLVVLAGALGIGIGFGLQNIVNNFVSGLILLFERPVKVGDMIMIESDWCMVAKIGMRATTVETLDQSEIIVPNSDLISQKVTNWTLTSEQSRVVLSVGVAYGSDVARVMDILTECAAEHPKVLDDPAPSAMFVNFGDSSLDFQLRAWVGRATERLETKSDLHVAIDRKFRENGVTIPFPQRDLHLRSIDPQAWKKLDPRRSATDE